LLRSTWRRPLGNFPGGVAETVVLKPATSGLIVADVLKMVSTNPIENRSFTYSCDANGQQTDRSMTVHGYYAKRILGRRRRLALG
jgi:hypothetical protein